MDLDLAAGLVIILVIGLFAGVVFDRVARPSWFKDEIAGTARAVVTSALIGIAGAFIGFHVGYMLELSPYALLATAVLGAILALVGWRMLR
jgi:uncharacterized membrane protein YeaQ/YmgE (transglycosylase-associated protein family)